MKLFVAILCVLAAANALVINQKNANDAFKFQEFMTTYSKTYATTADYDSAFHNFQQTLKRLHAREEKGIRGYGITKFADLSPKQFRDTYLLPKGSIDVELLKQKLDYSAPADIAPSTRCDCRSKNAVTPVKDQASCGSCWAFSTTENFESMWFLGGNQLVSLAPQQLVDCDTQSFGCQGGWTYWAFEYLMTAGGQELESAYPYTGVDGTCAFSASKIAARIGNYSFATAACHEASCPVQDDLLRTQLNSVGPLSICVNAETWSDWTGPEPMQGADCPGTGDALDHCVQLVGFSNYGADAGYWIVRNSWNTNWGQNGYIYLQTGYNTCGLGDVVTYANIKKSDDDEVEATTCA